jgi:hypothetical protein
MRVNQLYILAMDKDKEVSKVTVGLYRKYSPYAKDALAVFYEDGTFYNVKTLAKGNPKLPSTESTDLRHREFDTAKDKIPKIEKPHSTKETRANVGIYVILHGSFAMDLGTDGPTIARAVGRLVELGAKPDILCLLRCITAPPPTPDGISPLQNKKVPNESASTQYLVENLLGELKRMDCRPVLTAWSPAVSSSPGIPRLTREEKRSMPVGVKAFAPPTGPGEKPKWRRPTPEDREKYKFGYYVDEQNQIKVLTTSEVHSLCYR